PAPTESHTLSLHDALPIWRVALRRGRRRADVEAVRATGAAGRALVAFSGDRLPVRQLPRRLARRLSPGPSPAALLLPDRHGRGRSEEHTSELQSQSNLVCR